MHAYQKKLQEYYKYSQDLATEAVYLSLLPTLFDQHNEHPLDWNTSSHCVNLWVNMIKVELVSSLCDWMMDTYAKKNLRFLFDFIATTKKSIV